jgi:hypothetical protein
MGKFDAQERQAAGRPVPEDIRRMLSALVASSTASAEIIDIYEAAGIPDRALLTSGSSSKPGHRQPPTLTWRSKRSGRCWSKSPPR